MLKRLWAVIVRWLIGDDEPLAVHVDHALEAETDENGAQEAEPKHRKMSLEPRRGG